MRKARTILIGVAVLLLLVLVANQSLIDQLKEEDPLVAERDSNQDSATSDYRNHLADSSTLIDFEELVGLEPDELLGATNQLDEQEVFATLSQVLEFWTRRVEVDPLKYPVGSPGVYMFSEDSNLVRPLLGKLLENDESALALRLAGQIYFFPGVGPHDRANYMNMAERVFAELGGDAYSLSKTPAEIIDVFKRLEEPLPGSRQFARAYFDSLAEKDPLEASKWAIMLPDSLPGFVLEHVVSKWSERDGGIEAINFISSLPERINLDGVLSSIASRNIGNEQLVLTLLDSIEDEDRKDMIRYNQANNALKQGDPEKAFRWALTIKEDAIGAMRVMESFEQWAKKDRLAAENFLREPNQLDDQERSNLTRLLKRL